MPNQLQRRTSRREQRPALHPQRDDFHETEGEEDAALAREEILNRVPAGSDAQAAALNGADGGTRVRALEQLQGEHGNSYVQRVVNQIRVQRAGNADGATVSSAAPAAPQPERPQIDKYVEAMMKDDAGELVEVLKQQWIDDDDEAKMLRRVQKWAARDDAHRERTGYDSTDHLDKFLFYLKTHTFPHSSIRSAWVEQWTNAYDELFYELEDGRLDEFKRIVSRSKRQGTSGPEVPRMESAWSYVGKREAMGAVGLTKGLGTTLTGIADLGLYGVEKFTGVKTPRITGYVSEQFDETAKILADEMGVDVNEETLFGQSAYGVGTFGGKVVGALTTAGTMSGASTAAQVTMAGLQTMKGVEDLGDTIQKLHAAGLSWGDIAKRPDVWAQVVGVVGSAVGMAGGMSNATAETAKMFRDLGIAVNLSQTALLVAAYHTVDDDKTLGDTEKSQRKADLLEQIVTTGALTVDARYGESFKEAWAGKVEHGTTGQTTVGTKETTQGELPVVVKEPALAETTAQPASEPTQGAPKEMAEVSASPARGFDDEVTQPGAPAFDEEVTQPGGPAFDEEVTQPGRPAFDEEVTQPGAPAATARDIPALEVHPDMPNVLVEAGIPGFDMDALLQGLESTPQGSRIADRIRAGDVEVIISREPIISDWAGAASGKEIQITWGGSVEETVSTMVHEGTHEIDPRRTPAGEPVSSLSREAIARAFEYEQRMLEGLPPYDAAEQAYRDALTDARASGASEPQANLAAERAMIDAMRADPERYGVETAAQEQSRLEGTRGPLEMEQTPPTEFGQPQSEFERELFGDLFDDEVTQPGIPAFEDEVTQPSAPAIDDEPTIPNRASKRQATGTITPTPEQAEQLARVIDVYEIDPNSPALQEFLAMHHDNLDLAIARLEAFARARSLGFDPNENAPSGTDKITEGTANPRTRVADSPSEQLAIEMQREGMGPLPPGHSAHHIVAWDDARAVVARDILAEAGIGINEADNGIYLPQTPENTVSEALERHATIHTDAYYEALTQRLMKAAETGDVHGELARIRNEIAAGKFPH